MAAAAATAKLSHLSTTEKETKKEHMAISLHLNAVTCKPNPKPDRSWQTLVTFDTVSVELLRTHLSDTHFRTKVASHNTFYVNNRRGSVDTGMGAYDLVENGNYVNIQYRGKSTHTSPCDDGVGVTVDAGTQRTMAASSILAAATGHVETAAATATAAAATEPATPPSFDQKQEDMDPEGRLSKELLAFIQPVAARSASSSSSSSSLSEPNCGRDISTETSPSVASDAASRLVQCEAEMQQANEEFEKVLDGLVGSLQQLTLAFQRKRTAHHIYTKCLVASINNNNLK